MPHSKPKLGRLWRVHPAYAGVMCQSRSSASVAERFSRSPNTFLFLNPSFPQPFFSSTLFDSSHTFFILEPISPSFAHSYAPLPRWSPMPLESHHQVLNPRAFPFGVPQGSEHPAATSFFHRFDHPFAAA